MCNHEAWNVEVMGLLEPHTRLLFEGSRPSSQLRTFGADGLLSVIFLAGRPPGEFVVAHLHSAVSEPYSFDTRVGSTGYIESVAKIDHAFALKRVSGLLLCLRPP